MIRRYVRRHPVRTQRFLEILPGFFSWSLILFPIWGSFLFPTAVVDHAVIFVMGCVSSLDAVPFFFHFSHFLNHGVHSVFLLLRCLTHVSQTTYNITHTTLYYT